MKRIIYLLVLIFNVIIIEKSVGQQKDFDEGVTFLTPADTLLQPRLTALTIGGGLAYTSGFIALNNFWYRAYPRGRFRFFNDMEEWEQMDKAGHIFATYFQSRWTYKAFKWTGISENAAIWYGVGTGMLIQSTIEVLDGFSAEWGFSVPDMIANVAGGAAFGLQQFGWGEQRITFKVSGRYRDYSGLKASGLNNPEIVIPLNIRADELFGEGVVERFLKDYNAQSIWMSFNLNSFAHTSFIPSWLNIAVGYGAENMMGGFENKWIYKDKVFTFAQPRYRQFFLSPDIDFTRIPVKNSWWKTFFEALNIVKVPLPGVEWNTQGQLKVHWLVF